MQSVKHLYLHVPFCQSICAYCDFCHRLYDTEMVKKWLCQLKEELTEAKINKGIKTIYIGGGTPSSLSPEELKKLLELLVPYQKEVEEYTVEANPENLSEEKIKLLKEYGVNRISMGLQSSEDHLLKMMNRHHCLEDVKKKVELLRKRGITNISLDAMYSLPQQTMEMFQKTLEEIVEMDVPHISLYSLTIEPHTVFAHKGFTNLEEDVEADMYEMAVSYLTSKGYEHYEISNFTKKGYASRHNLGYWNYEDFYGISMGASGKVNGERYDNTRSFKEYLEGNYREMTLPLKKEEQMFEHVMMSLRTSYGLDLHTFECNYGISFFDAFKEAFQKHLHDFEVIEGHLIVKNRAILNTILVDFL